MIENRRRDNVFRCLNLLRSYYNKNGNLAGNLYDAIPPIKIKRKFLFIFSREPLNCLFQWRSNKR